MSATIPETMLLSDLLKPTGYDCPQDLQGKTFDQSTSGSGDVVLENNKEVTITENGTIEITPTTGHDYVGMKKVTANVNVAGGADIEANKAATINVSTYTEPVEITPTAGKDGMAKTTVTLSNIPSGSVPLYAWKEKTTNDIVYTNFSVAPTKIDAMDLNYKILYNSNNGVLVYSTVVAWAGIGQGEGYFTSGQDWGIEDSSFETESEYSRYAEGDIVLQA